MPTFVTAVNNNQILLDVVVTPIGADSITIVNGQLAMSI